MKLACIQKRGKIVFVIVWTILLVLISLLAQGSPWGLHSMKNGACYVRCDLQGLPNLKYRHADSVRFHVLVLYENGGHHLAYSKAAIPILNRWANENGFTVQYIHSPALLDSTVLSHYQLFIQLDYPPYNWPKKARLAFESIIQRGKIGWLGLHHATLLGQFDGFPMWHWFSWFMGGIQFKNYIADFASAYVDITDRLHPVMKGISPRLFVQREEWYTYDKLPDSYIKVLATVDESTYEPDTDIKMHGVHPVIWINTLVKARNLYIFMGHDPILWLDKEYKRLFWNAIFWAANKLPSHGFSAELNPLKKTGIVSINKYLWKN